MLLHKMQLCDRMHKVWLAMCVIAAISLYTLSVYFDFKLDPRQARRLFEPAAASSLPQGISNATKLILFWNTMFGDETFYFGPGDVFQNCPKIPQGTCFATHNRHITDIENFDAILFHGSELKWYDLPNVRKSHQKYIFTNLESPVNRPLPGVFESYFNLTMTYRLDSDIPWPYAVIADRATGDSVWPIRSSSPTLLPPRATGAAGREKIHQSTKWSRGKTIAAVWFVSNCKSRSGREKYVDELSKYIQVDIYGRCGRKQCDSSKDCFRTVVEPNYFFYLSFENSLCQDYVTEKLFNALRYNVVPVVYGGANYSLFAPPDSYINALDFESPRHLAKYLKKLTEEPKDYAKYFRWKERYEVANANSIAICQLCQLLHETPFQRKTYDPLSTWYYVDKCPLQDILQSHPYITKTA